MSKLFSFLVQNNQVISHSDFIFYFNKIRRSDPEYASFKELFPNIPFRIRTVHSIGKNIKRYELYTHSDFFSVMLIEFVLGPDFFFFSGDNRFFNVDLESLDSFFDSSNKIVKQTIKEEFPAFNDLYVNSYSNAVNVSLAFAVNLLDKEDLLPISDISFSDFEEYRQRANQKSKKYSCLESEDKDKALNVLFRYSGVEIFKKFSIKTKNDLHFLFNFLEISLREL